MSRLGSRVDYPMPSDSDSRQLILMIARMSAPKSRPRGAHRESLATIILGSLSASLGLVALSRIGTIWQGLASTAEQMMLAGDPDAVPTLATPDSFAHFFGLITVGHILGMAGIILAMYRRKRAYVASLGILLCMIAILPFYIMLAVWLIVILSPILLAVWAVRTVIRVAKHADRVNDEPRSTDSHLRAASVRRPRAKQSGQRPKPLLSNPAKDTKSMLIDPDL